MVSEISGNFAVTAEALNPDRLGALPTARITFQVGSSAPASAKRYAAVFIKAIQQTALVAALLPDHRTVSHGTVLDR